MAFDHLHCVLISKYHWNIENTETRSAIIVSQPNFRKTVRASEPFTNGSRRGGVRTLPIENTSIDPNLVISP